MEGTASGKALAWASKTPCEATEETKAIEVSTEPPAVLELEKPSFHNLALKIDEINMLKSKLEDKEKELEVFIKENKDHNPCGLPDI